MGFKIIEDRPTPLEVYGWRIYYQAGLAATGALLFGYDSGFFGSTIALASFIQEFGLDQVSNDKRALIDSNLVSTFQLGALAGALLFFPLCERFGRKIVLQVSGVLFQLGAGIQLYPTAARGLGAMYAGRCIAGLALGGITLVAPLYLAEVSPPGIRGRVVGLYEIAYQLGALVGFFINYGVQLHVPVSSKQWHIPIAVQLVYGGIFMVSTFLLVETPRFIQKRSPDDTLAAKQLAWIRNLPENHEYVQEELRQTRRGIEREREVLAVSGWKGIVKEMLMKGNRNRLAAGVAVMWFQNLSGINGINYYSPTIFKNLGITGTSGTLLGTGLYGVVKAVASIIFLIFLVDRVKRRHALMTGGVVCAIAMLYIAIYLQVDDPVTHPGPRPPQGTLAIVMIYVFVVSYCMSWNGLAWIICSEIFPLRIRVPCLAITTASQWAGQFTITRSTPYMLSNIKAGTYFFFFACLILATLWAKFILRETAGFTLEQMDKVWGYDAGSMTPETTSDDDGEKGFKQIEARVEAI